MVAPPILEPELRPSPSPSGAAPGRELKAQDSDQDFDPYKVTPQQPPPLTENAPPHASSSALPPAAAAPPVTTPSTTLLDLPPTLPSSAPVSQPTGSSTSLLAGVNPPRAPTPDLVPPPSVSSP